MPITRMSRRSAFTITELLVVFVVIALLVAILLPALTKARALTQQTQCQAHLRSNYQSLNVYQSDNDGLAPHRSPQNSDDVPTRYNTDYYSGMDIWSVQGGSNFYVGMGQVVWGGYLSLKQQFCPGVNSDANNQMRDFAPNGAPRNRFFGHREFMWEAAYSTTFFTSGTPNWDNELSFNNDTTNAFFRSDFAFRSGDYSYTDNLTDFGLANIGKARTSLGFTKPEHILNSVNRAMLSDGYENQHNNYDFRANSVNVAWVDGSVSFLRDFTRDMGITDASVLRASNSTASPYYEEDLMTNSSRRGGQTSWMNSGTIGNVSASGSGSFRSAWFDKINQVGRMRRY